LSLGLLSSEEFDQLVRPERKFKEDDSCLLVADQVLALRSHVGTQLESSITIVVDHDVTEKSNENNDNTDYSAFTGFKFRLILPVALAVVCTCPCSECETQDASQRERPTILVHDKTSESSQDTLEAPSTGCGRRDKRVDAF